MLPSPKKDKIVHKSKVIYFFIFIYLFIYLLFIHFVCFQLNGYSVQAESHNLEDMFPNILKQCCKMSFKKPFH